MQGVSAGRFLSWNGSVHLLGNVNPLYTLSGFCVGFIVGLTGVGGGSLMTPILVLLFGIHPATAVGTDLLYAAATKSVGTAVHGMGKTIEWPVVGLLAAGSVPATVATLLILRHFGNAGASGLITTVLGLALLLTSLAVFLRRRIVDFAARWRGAAPQPYTPLLTIVTGAILGVLVSLSSVGAGAIGVTALILLYPRLPTARIVGTDIAHSVPLTLAAGLGHWILGTVDWAIMAALLLGSLPGIVLGSLLMARLTENFLRPLLAAVLLVVGFKLLWR